MSIRIKSLWSFRTLIFVGGLLFIGGCLTTTRDFSSPQTTIHLVDESGSPLMGIEVGRSWYDCDLNSEGQNTAESDQRGIAQFSKVPGIVGPFTGTGRKMCSFIAICGSGSGTTTTIYVRYQGLYKVVPKGKTLHPVGQSNQDQDGVWFDTSTDSQGNTLANLTFPEKSTNIDYVLISSKLHH